MRKIFNSLTNLSGTRRWLLCMAFMPWWFTGLSAQTTNVFNETFSKVNGTDGYDYSAVQTADVSKFDNPAGWELKDVYAGQECIFVKQGGSITLPAMPELYGNATFYFSCDPWEYEGMYEKYGDIDEYIGKHLIQLSATNGQMSEETYNPRIAMASLYVCNATAETRITITAPYDMKVSGIRVYYGETQDLYGSDMFKYSPEAGTYYKPVTLTVTPMGLSVPGCENATDFQYSVYTTDGTVPTRRSPRLDGTPFNLKDNLRIQCATVTANGAVYIDEVKTYEIYKSVKPEIPTATYTVDVTAPGTLKTLLLDLNADIIEGLILKGRINGVDLAYINKGTGMMGSLKYLNLKDVTFEYDNTEYATRIDAPEGGMGTTYVYHYFLSQENSDEGAGGWVDRVEKNCYRNNMAGAFMKHPKLEYIVLPDFIPEIGEYAFYCSKQLKSVEHGNLSKVGNAAFYYAESLDDFELSEGLHTIGNGAFEGTKIFGDINLSAVKEIGNDAFAGTKITGITLADRADIGEGAFAGTILKEVEIPYPADSIKAGTFASATLQRIVIGEGAKYIGNSAFGMATDITLPSTIEFLDENALPVDYTSTLEAEDGIVYVGKAAYRVRGSQSSYKVKDGTVSLSPSLFQGTAATSYTLPASLKYIGKYAFAYCSSLARLTIPESVEYIGYGIVEGCNALWALDFNAIDANRCDLGWLRRNDIEQIRIGDKVKRIPEGLYTGNPNITDITLPASVEIIGNNAFNNCPSLRSVNIPGRIKELGGYAFYNCI